jgi:hypothetical protein
MAWPVSVPAVSGAPHASIHPLKLMQEPIKCPHCEAVRNDRFSLMLHLRVSHRAAWQAELEAEKRRAEQAEISETNNN